MWRPAGGEKPFNRRTKKDAQPTPIIGIARLSTWRTNTFVESLKTLIGQHGEIEKVHTEELVHGGESVTDVYIEFRSELVAEVVKNKIEGETVEGRKLQVKFVRRKV